MVTGWRDGGLAVRFRSARPLTLQNLVSSFRQCRDQLAAQSDASRKSLESELGAKLATAEAQIAETTARAMANVDAIASEAAGAIVERLTGKATTPDVIASAIAAAKQA